MRSGASGSDVLAARDRRAALIEELCAARSGNRHTDPPRTLVFASLAIPGPDKSPAGSGVALARGVEALRLALADRSPEDLDRGTDALGPWVALAVAGAPEGPTSEAADPDAVKHLAVGLEESLPFGRLLDLDVYGADARQVDRAALGLPPRRCLVCPESARECITLHRHDAEALAARVAALLEPLGPRRCPAAALAAALVRGAQEELDLTPKPGLVDRRDSGSHPDLTYDAMARSVALLPLYFDELVALRGPECGARAAREAGAGSGAPSGSLDGCVAAGRRAEARMVRAAGSNAHRGLVFLGGLVVLAACDACRDGEPLGEGELRRRVAGLAREFCGRPATGAEDTPGARARRAHGVDGILGEALAGLPSVFDAALPAYRATIARGDRRHAALRAMAALMATVEDTTALHRAGREGLLRLRRDGARLAALLDAGEKPDEHLTRWNDDYRRMGLTMGGVADCLALTLACDGA